jgi:hypothetical protein
MLAFSMSPDQVQAELLKWGLPADPSLPPGSTAQRQSPAPTTLPEGTTPETLALRERMEQQRLQGEAERALADQQRRQFEAFQRQQAAAGGYPNDPEGERLRAQMSQIDHSALPDNSGTMVLGPSGSQAPAGQLPLQGNSGSWPQSGAPGSAIPSGQTAQSPWNSGLPVTPAAQQTQVPPQTAGDLPPATITPAGQFQQAPVYRGLGSNQQTQGQILGQQSPSTGPNQQVGGFVQTPGGVHQAYGIGSQGQPEQAHFEAAPSSQSGIPSADITQVNGVNPPPQLPSGSQPPAAGNVNAFDAASRSAAIMGLGIGGGQMFPIATPMTPQVSPGAGSMNGAMYPEVERQLPTDRLMDFNQSFQYQPDGSMQSTAHEFRPAPNSIGQTMPSVMTQSQQAGASGMAATQWQSNAGVGSSAVPINPLAEYEQQQSDLDAQAQQTVQQTQGMTPSHYMVAPVSELNPQVPVVTGAQLMMNSPPGTDAAAQPNPWPSQPAASPPPASVQPSADTMGQGYGGTHSTYLPYRSDLADSMRPSLSQSPPFPQQPATPPPASQQSPSTTQRPWAGQTAPIEPIGNSPYYPVTNQLAPSPWQTTPRIDPNAVQSQPSTGLVTPPPYNPNGTPAASQPPSGTTQPAASSFAPVDPGPVIRPR